MVDNFSIISIISALCNLFVFSYVFGQRRNDLVSRTFLVFSFVTFLVCMIDALVHFPMSYLSILILTKAGMVVLIFSGIAYLDFVYAVVCRRRDVVFYIFLAFCAVCAGGSLFANHYAILLQGPYNASSIAPTGWSIPLLFSSFLPSVMAFFLLNSSRRAVQPLSRRKQVNLLFWGLVAAMVFYFLVMTAIPALFHTYSTYRLANIGAILNIVFIYRAIRKYNLMVVDTEQIEAVSNVIFQNVTDAVIIADLSKNIIQLNEVAKKIFSELPHPEAITALEQSLPGYRFAADYHDQGFDLTLTHGIRNLRISQTNITNSDGPIGKFIIIHDITEQKRIEEEIAQKTRLESLGQLAGGIAHDFNNQLAGIKGAADMLKSELVANPSGHELADMIGKSAQRSADLVRQLLAFARRGKFQMVHMDINAAVCEVVGLLERSIDKKIVVKKRLAASSPFVNGDPGQLHHALLNIALNSRDAITGGGEIVFLTNNVTLDERACKQSAFDIAPGPFVEIAVTDTGCGMDENVKERIFEPFFTTKQKGTGMGLAGVYGTIRNHGGAIRVESESGQGTSMKILLPNVNSPADAVQKSEIPFSRTSGASILVVEDEHVVRLLLQRLLEQGGHMVSTCTNGAEAVAFFEKNPDKTDLVLLDIIMPELNGLETFSRLRSIRPDLKVILMSGYSADGAVQGMIDNGAIGFVKKPFEAPLLFQAIDGALGTTVTKRPF